ncbi:MAG: D-sedoheptulose 7-phosphate isomerase [Candidatus Omnitrophica bacterium]|nr:D-sedoheptulose 7-phosphate isomerase [Candidatus Omnitrophota bacterium]
MKERIKEIFDESRSVKEATLSKNVDLIVDAVEMIIKALNEHGKILFFGNGGSAADSQHVAAEFIGRFQKERRALAAIALTTDSSVITSLSNDYDYNVVFARQIEALGRSGDVAFGFSTSGNSPNVIAGVKAARELGLKTIVLTGSGGGQLVGMADIQIDVPSQCTARIQESHMCIYHTICELVENEISDTSHVKE